MSRKRRFGNGRLDIERAPLSWDAPLTLAPWYSVVPAGEEGTVLFRRGDRLLRIGGAGVGLLGDLLGLISRELTAEEIVGVLGKEREPQAVAILEVLWQNDVLIPAPVGGADRRRRTSCDMLGANEFVRTLDDLDRRLAEVRIVVRGEGATAALVTAALLQAGVTHVAKSPLSSHEVHLPSPDLVIVCPSPDLLSTLREVNVDYVRSSQTWLPVVPYDGDSLQLGPLIVPGVTACWECTLRRRQAALDFGSDFDRVVDLPRQDLTGASLAYAAAGLAADAALRWAALDDPWGVGRASFLSPQVAELRTARVLRVPRCAVCSTVAEQPDPYPWSLWEAPDDQAPDDEAPDDEAPDDEATDDEAPGDEVSRDEGPGAGDRRRAGGPHVTVG